MMDIGDLIDDPELCEAFGIIRRVEVLTKGRRSVVEEEEAALGIVQPAQGKELERLPEADRSKETIAVYTRQQLQVGEGDGPELADGIRWRGGRYAVVSVESWAKYGYCKALCLRDGGDA